MTLREQLEWLINFRDEAWEVDPDFSPIERKLGQAADDLASLIADQIVEQEMEAEQARRDLAACYNCGEAADSDETYSEGSHRFGLCIPCVALPVDEGNVFDLAPRLFAKPELENVVA